MNRYQNIPQTIIEGKKVYKTVRYPEIPLSEEDIYVITTIGDRFDTLAQQYYKDSSLWWIISIANEQLKQNTLVVPEGIQIRIPYNPLTVLDSYNLINK